MKYTIKIGFLPFSFFWIFFLFCTNIKRIDPEYVAKYGTAYEKIILQNPNALRYLLNHSVIYDEKSYIRFQFANSRPKNLEKAKSLIKPIYELAVGIENPKFRFFSEKEYFQPIFIFADHYRKYDRKIIPVASDFRYVEGCEYRIGIPSGTNTFRFEFGAEEPLRIAKLIKTIDVPPDHSIRLKIDLSMVGQINKEEENHVPSEFRKYQVPILVSIERNPASERVKMCNFYRN